MTEFKKFKISDNDKIAEATVEVELCGDEVSLELEYPHNGDMVLAMLTPKAAREVAQALHSASLNFPIPVVEEKKPDGYIVRRSDLPVVKSFTNLSNRDNAITKAPNFFTDLEVAKFTAIKWATAHKAEFTVYAVTEVGTASPPVAPTAIWTEK